MRVLVLGYPLALTLAAKSLSQRPEITDQIEKFLLAQRGSASNETEISHGRVSWHLEAVEPAALVGGVEHTARNQCVDPSGEIVRAGE